MQLMMHDVRAELKSSDYHNGRQVSLRLRAYRSMSHVGQEIELTLFCADDAEWLRFMAFPKCEDYDDRSKEPTPLTPVEALAKAGG